MSQAVIQEVNMDVFARRIAPYFSWLESKIESGWVQSEQVTKDVLRETKALSTNMRARFILGVGKADFVEEIKRSIALFELASDAFPQESDEIDSKIESLLKGVSEELGSEFLPNGSLTKSETKIVSESPQVEVKKENKVEKASSQVKELQKSVEFPKNVQSVQKKENAKKSSPKKSLKRPEKQPVQKEERKEVKVKKNSPRKSLQKRFVRFSKSRLKNFSPVRWVREFIFGKD